MDISPSPLLGTPGLSLPLLYTLSFNYKPSVPDVCLVGELPHTIGTPVLFFNRHYNIVT